MKVFNDHPVASLARDIENGVWNTFPRLVPTAVGAWVPAMDIHEETDKFIIRGDLPGLKAEDIDIVVENNKLTVKGERKFESRVNSEFGGRFERAEGQFQRTFRLSDKVDSDGISASSRDGVLEIVIKKHDTVQSRRIEVQS